MRQTPQSGDLATDANAGFFCWFPECHQSGDARGEPGQLGLGARSVNAGGFHLSPVKKGAVSSSAGRRTSMVSRCLQLRGSLRPNPEHDAVRAFVGVHTFGVNSETEDTMKREGVIAVHPDVAFFDSVDFATVGGDEDNNAQEC